ncbi:MAG: LPS export ABC transporter permease LptG [bacterium]
MKLVTRYVLFQFLRLAAVCQAAAITLFLVAEFIERIDDFIEKKALLRDIVLYFAFKIPQLVILSLPLTMLLACVLSLILLSRGNEIVAMRACGASVYRIITPILLASLVIAGAHFLVNEHVIPRTNRRLNHIWNIRIKKYSPQGYNRTTRVWHRSADNTIWHITHYDPYRDRMRKATLYRLDGADRLVRRIDADRIEWIADETRWRFQKGLIHHFAEDGTINQESFEVRYFPVSDKPEDFKRTGKNPAEMNWGELRRYIDIMRTNGVDTTGYVVDLWGKISTPFVSFVLALVGVPFSLISRRSGGVALGVATTIMIGAGYLVLFYVGLSLGHAGRLPPLVAAWGPNALFLAGGIYLLARVRG